MSDKKRAIVLILLALVLVGIGVWQFSSGDKKQNKTQPEQAKANEEQKEQVAQLTNINYEEMGYVKKDPFRPAVLPNAEEPDAEETPPPAPQPQNNNNRRPIQPNIDTSVPLFDPMGNHANLSDAPIIRSLDEFAYTLVGIVDGPVPCAVFRSDSGTQRIVRLNSLIDNDSRVIGIKDGVVTVRHRDKTLKLSVGG